MLPGPHTHRANPTSGAEIGDELNLHVELVRISDDLTSRYRNGFSAGKGIPIESICRGMILRDWLDWKNGEPIVRREEENFLDAFDKHQKKVIAAYQAAGQNNSLDGEEPGASEQFLILRKCFENILRPMMHDGRAGNLCNILCEDKRRQGFNAVSASRFFMAMAFRTFLIDFKHLPLAYLYTPGHMLPGYVSAQAFSGFETLARPGHVDFQLQRLDDFRGAYVVDALREEVQRLSTIPNEAEFRFGDFRYRPKTIPAEFFSKSRKVHIDLMGIPGGLRARKERFPIAYIEELSLNQYRTPEGPYGPYAKSLQNVRRKKHVAQAIAAGVTSVVLGAGYCTKILPPVHPLDDALARNGFFLNSNGHALKLLYDQVYQRREQLAAARRDNRAVSQDDISKLVLAVDCLEYAKRNPSAPTPNFETLQQRYEDLRLRVAKDFANSRSALSSSYVRMSDFKRAFDSATCHIAFEPNSDLLCYSLLSDRQAPASMNGSAAALMFERFFLDLAAAEFPTAQLVRLSFPGHDVPALSLENDLVTFETLCSTEPRRWHAPLERYDVAAQRCFQLHLYYAFSDTFDQDANLSVVVVQESALSKASAVREQVTSYRGRFNSLPGEQHSPGLRIRGTIDDPAAGYSNFPAFLATHSSPEEETVNRLMQAVLSAESLGLDETYDAQEFISHVPQLLDFNSRITRLERNEIAVSERLKQLDFLEQDFISSETQFRLIARCSALEKVVSLAGEEFPGEIEPARILDRFEKLRLKLQNLIRLGAV